MCPVSSFFTGRVLHYKTVYGHFCKWSRNVEWEKVWGIVLLRDRSFLDMSGVELDGSQTTALRASECCGYEIGLIRRYLVGRHRTLYCIHTNYSQVDKKRRKIKLTSMLIVALWPVQGLSTSII